MIFERVDLKDFKVIIPSEISLEISLFLKIERGRKLEEKTNICRIN